MKTLTPSNIKMYSRLGTCGTLGMALGDIAEEIPELAVVTADLCFYSGLDRFKKKYPEKLYNVGIAEQNLIGVAAGLAKEGFDTFATTYASFAVTRALDQVRVNMGYMKLPIKLIGLTSGFSVGILGATHICIEDIAIARSIPNMVVLSPADSTEMYRAVVAAANIKKPVYIRLTGGMNQPVVYKEDFDYQIGKANILKEGNDITIIATGTMVYVADKVVEKLEKENISATLIDMHTIKPLDEECIKAHMKCRLLVTMEEHSVIGGLGGAVAELLAARECHPRLLKIGIADEYAHAGSYEYLLEKYGLTVEKITENIIKTYKEVV